MVEIFTKRPAEPQSARAEAAGLRWLREASAQVAEVVSVDDHHISTRAVTLVQPTPAAARAAGHALAHIHRAGAPAFGCPPSGWEGPNYIGIQQQSCFATKTWGEFYATQRVLSFAQKAKKLLKGGLARRHSWRFYRGFHGVVGVLRVRLQRCSPKGQA